MKHANASFLPIVFSFFETSAHQLCWRLLAVFVSMIFQYCSILCGPHRRMTPKVRKCLVHFESAAPQVLCTMRISALHGLQFFETNRTHRVMKPNVQTYTVCDHIFAGVADPDWGFAAYTHGLRRLAKTMSSNVTRSLCRQSTQVIC